MADATATNQPEEEPIDPAEYERVRHENGRLRREHARLFREYQRLSTDFKGLKEKLDEAAIQNIEKQAQASVTASEQALSRQPLITNLPRVMIPPRPKGAMAQKRAAEAEEEEMAKRQKLAKEKAAAAQLQKEQAVAAELAELGAQELLERFCKLSKKPVPEIPDPDSSGATFSCMGDFNGESLVGQGPSAAEARLAFATELLLKMCDVTTVDEARAKVKTLKLKSMKKQ
eukprot:TRINITY_DN1881_c0_g1_i1.p2 TRINITY_DN1881_c0_g1~~TRINITY_DN1881_c0_g1_i1.p2  ORF type:complete len:259 (+),score=141.63 TRINITY_DN1881_c0_g1_i1:88-777(+)